MLPNVTLGLNDGCTYKVYANCSWPSVMAPTADVDILSATVSGGVEADDNVADDQWILANKTKTSTTAKPPSKLQTTQC